MIGKLFSFRYSPIRDYMKRWILSTPWGTLRLHKIMRSDLDRDMHDHPWDFTSLILSGGYFDHTPEGTKAYVRGMVNHKKAEDRHRLTLIKPTWTFVVSGPMRRAWGFHTPTGWVYWKNYLNVNDEPTEQGEI